MRNQARLAEKGKWIDPPELAETLDNYVADVADMNYSKNEFHGKYKGKKFFKKNENFNDHRDEQVDSAKSNDKEEVASKHDKQKKAYNNGDKKGPNVGSSGSAPDQNRPPCSHCKQTTPFHTPMNCWKNVHGPKFRPELVSNSKIKRVFQ